MVGRASVCRMRATVAMYVFAAPARRKMRPHSEAVVPVVNPLTDKMPCPTTSSFSATLNGPGIFSLRSCRESPIGLRRRYDRQPASPGREQRTSVENAKEPGSRSPQREQNRPALGCRARRQGSQTGSREMFIMGVPQRRQAEGNSLTERPAAIPPAPETNGLSCATTLVPVARIGVRLLLKTILLHPVAATGTPTGQIFSSIAVREAGSNDANLRHLRRQPPHLRRVVVARHGSPEPSALKSRIPMVRTLVRAFLG
jgi:hypothetical protein